MPPKYKVLAPVLLIIIAPPDVSEFMPPLIRISFARAFKLRVEFEFKYISLARPPALLPIKETSSLTAVIVTPVPDVPFKYNAPPFVFAWLFAKVASVKFAEELLTATAPPFEA